MRFSWLLALLLLTCSGVRASADTIDYAGAGSLSGGTAGVVGSLTAGHTWALTEQLIGIDNLTTGKIVSGVLGFVTISLDTLSVCDNGMGLCFSAGSIDVDSNSGSDLFRGTFTRGEVRDGTIFISAEGTNNASIVLAESGNFSSDTLTLAPAATPEVASVGLLGIGLLSLAGLKKLLV